MNKLLFSILVLALMQVNTIAAQTAELPFSEISDYPEEFTAGTMAARMVESLGFRYYWATDNLTQTDLDFQPNEDARTIDDTVEHILGLSSVIVNSTLKQPNDKQDTSQLTFKEMRSQTLLNLKMAADILRGSEDISQYKIIFGEREIPFWNQVNGPIADAIWHCGQIASFRRMSGNPINAKVNHFTGTVTKD